MKTCSVEGCTRTVYARGRCRTHDRQIQLFGEIRPIKPYGRRCQVEGCNRKHEAHGWCKLHHDRVRRNGHPHKVKGTGEPCKVDGCERPRYGRGWCRMHWSRWYRHGDPTTLLIHRNRPCSIPGCDSKHYAKGLCFIHRMRGLGIAEAKCYSDREPRVSVAPLLPYLERCRDAGINRTRAIPIEVLALTPSLLALGQSLSDICSSKSATSWTKQLNRILNGTNAAIKIGDADAICYALGFHPCQLWPELWFEDLQEEAA